MLVTWACLFHLDFKGFVLTLRAVEEICGTNTYILVIYTIRNLLEILNIASTESCYFLGMEKDTLLYNNSSLRGKKILGWKMLENHRGFWPPVLICTN